MSTSTLKPLQEALYQPLTSCRALQVYKLIDASNSAELKTLISRIMRTFEEPTYSANGLKVLFAVHPKLVEENLQAAGVSTVVIETIPAAQFNNDAGELLIQVSANNTSLRSYALRLCETLLQGLSELKLELLAETDTFSSEAFGFYQKESKNDPDTVCNIGTGPLEGCSWLLMQDYELDIARFFRQTDEAQFQTVGSVFVEESRLDPRWKVPKEAHTKVMDGVKDKILRRGFNHRADGKEYLCFVMASKELQHFVAAYLSMSATNSRGEDLVFGFAATVPGDARGGVYFVPQSADFLDATSTAIDVVHEAKAAYVAFLNMQELGGAVLVDIINYAVGKDFVRYMSRLNELRAFNSAPGSQTIDSNIKTVLNKIHRYLARTSSNDVIPPVKGHDPKIEKELNDLLDGARKQGNEINRKAKKYKTLA